ncbi:retropepsin-like protein [Gossypium australe]|uniref:Retropepsin-like protein n=1 Tax=Gossypium australe TaxID=47621 RepID=A0A5B6WIS5_9ROSI|nr:retropepsin-like protein [Gossypium australe]
MQVSSTSLEAMINKLSANGKLLSQTEPNPRENANVVMLRSGKELKPNPGKNHIKIPPRKRKLKQDQRGKEKKEILETFRKVEVNKPLSDAIKQILRYAKFLKDLCTNKQN